MPSGPELVCVRAAFCASQSHRLLSSWAACPLGPDPVRFVGLSQLAQFHPKIRAANGVVLLPPVAALPSDHPPSDSLPSVLSVGRDFYFARLLKREEPLDRRHQLHSIVGSVSIVPEEFSLHRIARSCHKAGQAESAFIYQSADSSAIKRCLAAARLSHSLALTAQDRRDRSTSLAALV
jgi:hypothetical protein